MSEVPNGILSRSSNIKEEVREGGKEGRRETEIDTDRRCAQIAAEQSAPPLTFLRTQRAVEL